jgi:prolyl oligopeptidase
MRKPTLLFAAALLGLTFPTTGRAQDPMKAGLKLSPPPAAPIRPVVDGTDRLLIDPERLPGGAEGHLAIEWYRPSPDNRYIAYGLAADGSEDGVLHLLDTTTGEELPERADRAEGSVFWRADGRSFFYSRRQELAQEMPATAKWENIRVYLHELGRGFDEDPVIVGRGTGNASIPLTPMERPFVVTKPGSRFAVAGAWSGVDRRVRIYTAPIATIMDGTTAWRPIAPSLEDQFIAPDGIQSLALHGDILYWLSRKDAPRGKILSLDLSQSDSKPRVVVAEGELPISAVYAAQDALYWRESDAGINRVQRLRYTNGAGPEMLRLPYAADIARVITDAAGDAVILSAWSWIRSPAYLGLDARTGRVADTGLQPAGPYDRADDLVVEEVRVESWDGTLVPLSIVYRKGLARDGTNPTLLFGYGAYGINNSPAYFPEFRALYDRGMINATCHARGGGEFGDAWHKAGFQETKPNTWKDFIACAEYLVAHKYTSPQKLSAEGGSAGGILVGRAIQERPDLFAAAAALVPTTDMLRFETTANGPPNEPEFGSTKTEAGFRALYAMSPYAHVEDGVKYPAVLITTGINDPHVDAWEAAKLAARLQAATASGKPVLLRVDYDAGHGSSTIDQWLESFADMVSSVLWQTGDPEFQPRLLGMAPAPR